MQINIDLQPPPFFKESCASLKEILSDAYFGEEDDNWTLHGVVDKLINPLTELMEEGVQNLERSRRGEETEKNIILINAYHLLQVRIQHQNGRFHFD